MLIYAILSDKNFKAKKYLLRADGLVESEYCISDAFERFLDKVLKHAGVSSSNERSLIIEGFELGMKDTEWITDAVDEAMYIYTECGKNMRMFRDKMIQMSIKKMVRSGKYDGKITYKKTVVDRALAYQKRQAVKK